MHCPEKGCTPLELPSTATTRYVGVLLVQERVIEIVFKNADTWKHTSYLFKQMETLSKQMETLFSVYN